MEGERGEVEESERQRGREGEIEVTHGGERGERWKREEYQANLSLWHELQRPWIVQIAIVHVIE